MAGTHLGAAAIVPIAVQAEAVTGGRIPVHTKPALSHMPRIGGPPSIGQQRGITTEALAVDSVIGMRAERAAVARRSEARQLSAAATRDQESLGVFRVLRDDVDQAI